MRDWTKAANFHQECNARVAIMALYILWTLKQEPEMKGSYMNRMI